MKEFIIKYWHELLGLALLLIVTLLTLFKPKVKVFDSIKMEILKILPGLINVVEHPGDGSTKLVQVIGAVNAYLSKLYPDFKVGSYDEFIILAIESILSTPQKKEVPDGKR